MSVAITMHVTEQRPNLMVNGPTMNAGSMLLGALGSDADVSIVIGLHQESLPMAQPTTKLLQRH